MKKLIFGLSLLLVAVASLFIFSGNTNTVSEDNNESQVTECAKKDDQPKRDGDPDDGVALF